MKSARALDWFHNDGSNFFGGRFNLDNALDGSLCLRCRYWRVRAWEGCMIDWAGQSAQACFIGCDLAVEIERGQRAPVEGIVKGDHALPTGDTARDFQ